MNRRTAEREGGRWNMKRRKEEGRGERERERGNRMKVTQQSSKNKTKLDESKAITASRQREQINTNKYR
jgi:hypothetical protein